MDDMNAFERQVVGQIRSFAGPSRPVDDAAIFTAITTTQSPKWRFQSMFSATKFVVAGVVVALFGGFLLTGVLTQPSEEPLPVAGASASATAQAEPTEATTNDPEPTPEAQADMLTEPDLLPGVDLVVEEVEPGVFRVDHDGIRHPRVWTGHDVGRYTSIVAGQDDSLWLFGQDTFFRVGDDATHRWVGSPFPGSDSRRDDVEVGLDGVLWWAGPRDGGLRSFDGDAWTLRLPAPLWGAVLQVETGADGSVWAVRQDDTAEEVSVSRLEGDEWRTLRTWPIRNDLYGMSQFANSFLSIPSTNEAWMLVDDSLWGVGPSPGGRAELWRLSGDQGERWEPVSSPGSDIMRSIALPLGGVIGAGPDGSVWTLPGGEGTTLTYDAFHATCAGVANFDGSARISFLTDLCVEAADVAPDGSLWLIGEGPNRGDIYVITPEAVAATE